MKNKFNKWFILIIWLTVTITQIIDYFLQQNFNAGLIGFIIGFSIIVLKNWRYEISKKTEWIVAIIAIIIMIYLLVISN
tara:strand:+ start:205 stop:441 length:237 start_codon:yes stop_codon:yes gene_type:complete